MLQERHHPRIETERLILTIPTPGDASRMVQYVTDNEEHLAPWEPLKTDEYFTLEFWFDRLSFSVEGHARDYLRLAGEWQDHTLTSLINESWKEVVS